MTPATSPGTGGVRYRDALQWLPKFRPYLDQSQLPEVEYLDQCYLITHVIFTLSNWCVPSAFPIATLEPTTRIDPNAVLVASSFLYQPITPMTSTPPSRPPPQPHPPPPQGAAEPGARADAARVPVREGQPEGALATARRASGEAVGGWWSGVNAWFIGWLVE